MAKCDKYIRMVSSLLKTYRAYHPQKPINALYKQLVEARRVIRWEGKYDIAIELITKKHATPMLLFKIMQLVGDLTDLTAFWLALADRHAKRHQQLIQILEQAESNMYFTECCIWFAIYLKRFLQAKRA